MIKQHMTKHVQILDLNTRTHRDLLNIDIQSTKWKNIAIAKKIDTGIEYVRYLSPALDIHYNLYPG